MPAWVIPTSSIQAPSFPHRQRRLAVPAAAAATTGLAASLPGRSWQQAAARVDGKGQLGVNIGCSDQSVACRCQHGDFARPEGHVPLAPPPWCDVR